VTSVISALSIPPSSGRAVFLSYTSDNAAVAERVASALRDAGIDVWFDGAELRGGDAWDAEIGPTGRRSAE
jgi:hypothetical protein